MPFELAVLSSQPHLSIFCKTEKSSHLYPKKIIDFLSANTMRTEEVFSSKKYLGVALVVTAIAGAIFTICWPAALCLIAISAWNLWSAKIIIVNRYAAGTAIEKPVHQLHATSMEINSAFASAALFCLTLFNQYHRPHGNPRGQPILMVNGYLSFGSTWHYQRQKLADAGLGPIYTMNVGSGQSIKTYAKQIQEKVQHIQKETGRDDLILIGHSKGGLVSAYYATYLAAETNTKVTDVVTIASPIEGTPFANVLIGHDAEEMRPGSEFHKELRKKMKEHPEIRFCHIASEEDRLVPVSSALFRENYSRHLLLKDIGHLGLIFSSRVADQICTWLKAMPK